MPKQQKISAVDTMELDPPRRPPMREEEEDSDF